jgi:hypothetical protein
MTIACIYIPAFPAWVQERAHDRQNVAVHDDDRIVSCSRSLRQQGLEPGSSLDRARELFPKASFHPRDPRLEEVYWEEVLAQIYGITPHLLSLEPGWLLCRGNDTEALQKLTTQLRAKTGIAPERPVARLAALRAGPGHPLKITSDHTDRFLEQTDVEYLKDIGFEESCIERLKLFGLTTAYDVKKLSRRHLEAQFETHGHQLYTFFHPDPSMENIPAYQFPPTIDESYEFERAATEPGDIFPVLKHLIERTTERLGDHRCRRVSVRLYGEDSSSPRIMTRLLKDPTAHTESLLRGARLQMEALLKAQPLVYRLEVELGGLVRREAAQGQLFFQRPSVKKAFQAVLKRFPNRLFRPTLDNPHGRLPEETAKLVELQR